MGSVRRCTECEREIVLSGGRGRPPLTCPGECRARRLARRVRVTSPYVSRAVRERRVCVCGESFVSVKADQVFCRSLACASERRLAKTYGLSIEDLRVLRSASRCDSCGVAFAEHDGRRRVVDHDHVSGAVRGVLCDGCNVTAGHLESVRAADAAAYLARASLDLRELCVA